MKEKTKLLIIAAGFLAAYYIPWDHEVIRRSGLEAFMMLQEYARQHVLTCLIPAFFIAGVPPPIFNEPILLFQWTQ